MSVMPHRCILIPLLFYLTLISAVHADNPQPLFQNRFFTLSVDNRLICSTSKSQFTSLADLKKIIAFYEKNSGDLRSHSVAVLTDHADPDRRQDLLNFREKCRDQPSPDLCVLEKYWDSRENALRVLALFYDTKTIIKHSDNYHLDRFQPDHVRVFEKAIRKIPPFLRKSISRAKPMQNLDKVIAKAPVYLRTQILEVLPEDYLISIWRDRTRPLMIVPGNGYRFQTVAQVYNGQNLILVTTRLLDKAKDGNMYRDINLKYLVDFRLPILIHEIAHTIDNFHFWNGSDDLYFFYRYRKISTDNTTMQRIRNARLALWPSRWFEAFEYLWEVNDGRYNGIIQEKLAELVAQYVLIPERLRVSSPYAYQWLRSDVFQGIEYEGYDSCPAPVTKPLNFWEDAVAKLLGR